MTKQSDLIPVRAVKVKIDSKGGFIIPPEFCYALDLNVGDEILMCWKDDELRIAKVHKRKARTRGRARH